MAFTSGSIWEVEVAGSDTLNGGGFDSGVAGFPTDGAATLANTASPVFTSASYNFVAGDVGAWIYIKSGTNWIAGMYQIASVAANAATLSAATTQAVLLGIGTTNGFNSMSTSTGCAPVASPTAATWGIDYSQQASAQISFSDLVIDGTTNTKFTSAGHPVGKNFVGNILKITSGTGFTVQRVAVVSTSGTTATCDKALGTVASTGGNAGLGGALLSGGIASSVQTSSNLIFIKAGTYSITSATTDISGGAWNNGVFTNTSVFVGYTSNRFKTNTDTRPLIQLAATTITLTNSNHFFVNFDFDGNSQTTSKIVGGSAKLIRCSIKNCTAANLPVWAAQCTATGNSGTAFQCPCFSCEAYANTVTPFAPGASGLLINCLSYGNTGASTDGVNGGGALINCVAYNNGRHGFTTSSTTYFANCHAEGNVNLGYNGNGNTMFLVNCGSYNNTGGRSAGNLNNDVSPLTLSASAFNNAAGNDFSLNNTAGGGANLRGTGFGAFPRGVMTGYPDVGAVQHQDSPPFHFFGSQNFAPQ